MDNIYNILEVKNDILIPFIYNNCKVKATVVQQDEKDKGIRKTLYDRRICDNIYFTFGDWQSNLSPVGDGQCKAGFKKSCSWDEVS
ncbi:hypothetical protein P0092_17335 [Ruminiclostridium papyrosolvens DSM 2782]|uniref:hypothetical protein n=1 Tax=Ruminiclostridium papyrosolvens TaxID=29362 RepID=UPI0001B26745|nr:hypothetical protein [Ruminiclostridium papyrosolvens]WES33512.1 hypothetical protein P0092_17335 [Ruminiclostridium papyrosolvens DSM 2782]